MTGMHGGPGGNGFTGGNFRFRTDAGTEVDDDVPDGAAWLDAINTDISLSISAGTFRLRMAYNFEDPSSVNKAVQMRYSHNGGGFFTVQGNQDGNFVGHVESESKFLGVDNLDDSTEYSGLNQLFTGTWADTTQGQIITEYNFDSTGICNFAAEALRGMSTEWCLHLKPLGDTETFDLDAGDTLDFKLYVDNSIFTGGYPEIPRLNLTAAVHDHPYISVANNARSLVRAVR